MIAVLGANGQLGSGFVRALGEKCRPVTRDQLDLSDLDSIGPFLQTQRPETVINCAAYTGVDAAESDSDVARLVNAPAVGVLATGAAALGARFVTFSTDYVFDGEKETGYVESDRPNPLNVYGKTKLAGERLALEAHSDALVVRTSWVLSATHHNFLTTILERLAQDEVSVVDDQRGRPTLVDDLVGATLQAVDSGTTGILHLANQGVTTWYGLAVEIAALAGYDPDSVKPISSADLDRPARRPANSVLDSERLDGLGLTPMPHYRGSLVTAVEGLHRTQGNGKPSGSGVHHSAR